MKTKYGKIETHENIKKLIKNWISYMVTILKQITLSCVSYLYKSYNIQWIIDINP